MQYWASGLHPVIPLCDLARAQNVVLKALCTTSQHTALAHGLGTKRVIGFLAVTMTNLRHLTVLANESDNCAHYQPRQLGNGPRYIVQNYDPEVHNSYNFWVASVLRAIEQLAHPDLERGGPPRLPFWTRLQGFHLTLRIGEYGWPRVCSGLRPTSTTETPDGSGIEGSKDNPVYHQPFYVWELPGVQPRRPWFTDP
ncbi:hypothetical protein B0T19DRAFT_405809 [Cercophora scortea]|uniref:Uncharacterized protein n=1 Tax=Cercophora scortea TaxID=314031 RepID=A0AAE0J1L5_9PEZI|nr:hypothetical protein B0T19DRAFT_405809 [Cercophora scortea]